MLDTKQEGSIANLERKNQMRLLNIASFLSLLILEGKVLNTD